MASPSGSYSGPGTRQGPSADHFLKRARLRADLAVVTSAFTVGELVNACKIAADGDYRFLVELDDYAALDASSATMMEPDNEWRKILAELTGFWQLEGNPPRSNELLRNVMGAAIWDPETLRCSPGALGRARFG